jgi:hypothetical protein
MDWATRLADRLRKAEGLPDNPARSEKLAGLIRQVVQPSLDERDKYYKRGKELRGALDDIAKQSPPAAIQMIIDRVIPKEGNK